MPIIEFRISKGGKIDADFDGFSGDMCDQAQQDMINRLKRLKLETVTEERKDDELLQEETQCE